MSDTEKKAPAEKPAKAEKPKKEKPAPPVRNWANSEYKDRKVFTPKGTGHVVSEDKKGGRFLVKIDGTDHDIAEKSVRFKAVDDKYRETYEVDKTVRTLSGAPSISCGDIVSQALKGLVETELGTLAEENGLTDNWLKWGQNGLNPGQRRMNLGNMLRTRLKKSKEEGSNVEPPVFFGNSAEKSAEIRHKQLAEESAKAAKEQAAKKAEREKAEKAKAAKKKEADKKKK